MITLEQKKKESKEIKGDFSQGCRLNAARSLLDRSNDYYNGFECCSYSARNITNNNNNDRQTHTKNVEEFLWSLFLAPQVGITQIVSNEN